MCAKDAFVRIFSSVSKCERMKKKKKEREKERRERRRRRERRGEKDEESVNIPSRVARG